MVSEDITTTGKFFGEVDGNAMNMLIEKRVFRKVHIFDYQAICFREDGSTSDASFVTKVSSFDGIHHDVRESTSKVETMVRQAQLIYCAFITGYMFRPIYRSSSGVLTRESVNGMHVGIPSCLQR